MHGAERDGEEDLRGEVEFVAVAQQHAETTIDKRERHRNSAALLL